MLCQRSVFRWFTLCTAITSVTLAAQSARAQESVTAQSAPPASEMYDKDFAKHVDIRMLGIAWQTLDAKLMADVALQLREAEKVVGRNHPKITSKQILTIASKVAVDGGDKQTLDRLARVAEANGDKTEISRLKQLQSLAAQSRGLDGGLKDSPMFSANDVNNGALAAYANMMLQIRAAKVSGNRDTLTSLAEGTDLLSSLGDSQRSRLKGLIDDAVETIGDPDDSLPAIQLLAGASRSIVSPPVAIVSLDPPTKDAAQTSSNTEKANAAGGMLYVMTPLGAAVKSPGRIGSLVLVPGDLIMNMTGSSVSSGRTVDKLIDLGYLTGNRSLYVRDGESGQVSSLSF